MHHSQCKEILQKDGIGTSLIQIEGKDLLIATTRASYSATEKTLRDMAVKISCPSDGLVFYPFL